MRLLLLVGAATSTSAFDFDWNGALDKAKELSVQAIDKGKEAAAIAKAKCKHARAARTCTQGTAPGAPAAGRRTASPGLIQH